MLLQFTFKNYKSFRDEVTLDFTAAKITEHSSRILYAGNEKVLPVAAIYGANASGKSNIFDAFKFMHYYVQESFAFGGDNESRRDTSYIKVSRFLFDNSSKNSESTFEVYFANSADGNGKCYNYGFCVDQEGVCEEWLNGKTKSARKYTPVFYRNRITDELDLGKLPKSSQENIKAAIEKEVLIVSLGAKLKIAKLKVVRDWFLSNEFADFGDPIENFFLSRQLPRGFVNDDSVRKKVVDFFSLFDNQIKDFTVAKNQGEKDKETYSVESIHQIIDSNETASIPLNHESAGTLKMFALYQNLQNTLKQGSVFVVDELNARLHPLLVRNLVLSFLNPELNKHGAQLIFTTHDTWQLTNNLLRRDEIWFTEKDERGISTLYSLADFVDQDGVKIRKDENYEKNYLLGKYGAIPSLKNISFFSEE